MPGLLGGVLGGVLCGATGITSSSLALAAPSKSAAASATPTAPRPAEGKAVAPANFVQLKLQHALEDSLAKIPNIEPWQKRIFNEEVLAHPQRFVRDYRASGSGAMMVDVDMDGLRSYLRFHGPKSLKRDTAPFLVLLREEEGCDKCKEADASLRKLVMERLERRGITPVWATPTEVSVALAGRALEEQVATVASDKKLAGYLIVHALRSPVDDVDSAHADEQRFLVREVLVVSGVSRHEGQLEIYETGNFEKTARQIMTDSFADLGVQIERAVVAGEIGRVEREGISLEVDGLKDHAQYAALRTQLQDAAFARNGTFQVEEQRISRARVVFSVFTDKSPSELRKALAGLGFGTERGRARLTPSAQDPGGDAKPVVMEVR